MKGFKLLSLKSPMSSPSSTASPLAAASASAASRAATIFSASFLAHTSGLQESRVTFIQAKVLNETLLCDYSKLKLSTKLLYQCFAVVVVLVLPSKKFRKIVSPGFRFVVKQHRNCNKNKGPPSIPWFFPVFPLSLLSRFERLSIEE